MRSLSPPLSLSLSHTHSSCSITNRLSLSHTHAEAVVLTHVSLLNTRLSLASRGGACGCWRTQRRQRSTSQVCPEHNKTVKVKIKRFGTQQDSQSCKFRTQEDSQGQNRGIWITNKPVISTHGSLSYAGAERAGAGAPHASQRATPTSAHARLYHQGLPIGT